MPWRTSTDPYYVIVSEIMLQQTQVSRVVPKFELFIHEFPTIDNLARAPLSEVLQVWVGLGYNRRAKYLHMAAQQIEQEYGGQIPRTLDELIKLPGIGHNTAAAIMNYAYNTPVVFIETNIRTVYLHHFFPNETDVHDKQLLPLVESTLPVDNPREWFWAIMDYGSHIKSQHPNPSRRSKHHSKQSKFEGSSRQLRGKILKLLLKGPATYDILLSTLEDSRTPKIITNLEEEKLIKIHEGIVSLD